MGKGVGGKNGTGPYSGSGSTKAKLAPSSSFSPRPTFRRRPAASSSTPIGAGTASDPQFLSPIVVSALGDPVQDEPDAGRREHEKISRERPSSARNSADIWHKLLGRCRHIRGCTCAAKDGRKREQGRIRPVWQQVKDMLVTAAETRTAQDVETATALL